MVQPPGQHYYFYMPPVAQPQAAAAAAAAAAPVFAGNPYAGAPLQFGAQPIPNPEWTYCFSDHAIQPFNPQIGVQCRGICRYTTPFQGVSYLSLEIGEDRVETNGAVIYGVYSMLRRMSPEAKREAYLWAQAICPDLCPHLDGEGRGIDTIGLNMDDHRVRQWVAGTILYMLEIEGDQVQLDQAHIATLKAQRYIN